MSVLSPWAPGRSVGRPCEALDKIPLLTGDELDR